MGNRKEINEVAGTNVAVIHSSGIKQFTREIDGSLDPGSVKTVSGGPVSHSQFMLM